MPPPPPKGRGWKRAQFYGKIKKTGFARLGGGLGHVPQCPLPLGINNEDGLGPLKMIETNTCDKGYDL